MKFKSASEKDAALHLATRRPEVRLVLQSIAQDTAPETSKTIGDLANRWCEIVAVNPYDAATFHLVTEEVIGLLLISATRSEEPPMPRHQIAALAADITGHVTAARGITLRPASHSFTRWNELLA